MQWLVISGIAPILVWFGAFSAYAQITLHQWPKIGEYVYFSLLFGQGFFLHAIGTDSTIVLLIGICAIAFYFGLYLLFYKKDRFGLILLYLVCVQFLQVPYYMGRSVFPTLYSISLPFLLICGCIVEYLRDRWRLVESNRILEALLILCFIILYIPMLRGLRITSSILLHSAEEIVSTVSYVQNAVQHWSILETPQYRFLSRSLPPGCAMASFDYPESELLMSLHRKPAFQYAFIREFITNAQQVDSLRVRGTDDICLFVNHAYIEKKNQFMYGVYAYFWKQYGGYAQLIAEDPAQGFALYRMKAEPLLLYRESLDIITSILNERLVLINVT